MLLVLRQHMHHHLLAVFEAFQHRYDVFTFDGIGILIVFIAGVYFDDYLACISPSVRRGVRSWKPNYSSLPELMRHHLELRREVIQTFNFVGILHIFTQMCSNVYDELRQQCSVSIQYVV
jgi:hypothetical protein